MLFVSKIVLKNIRCFEEVTIDLFSNGSPNSAVIAGNNGSGKTAILRSLAMGLCDQVSAGSLLRELLGDFIRKDTPPFGPPNVVGDRVAIITIKLVDNVTKDNYSIETVITTNDKLGFESVEQALLGPDGPDGPELKQNNFPFDGIFVVGYGAGLRTEGQEDYAQFFAADSVYSLFKYSHTLQNPELVWRRLKEIEQDANSAFEEDIGKKIERSLIKILSLTEATNSDMFDHSVSLEGNGIYVSSSWGRQNLNVLGDGYRALTNIVMDILGWQLLKQNNDVILNELATGREDLDWVALDWGGDYWNRNK